MSSSGASTAGPPAARSLSFTTTQVVVELTDGRTIAVPLDWYPRLLHATPAERANWELIAEGEGFHWPDLDEDLSVDGFLGRRRSGESPQSLERWLRARGMK